MRSDHLRACGVALSVTIVVGLLSCSNGETACPTNIETTNIAFGLRVVVRDRVSGQLICGATVVAHDGAYFEKLAGEPEFREEPCSGGHVGAEERPGNYEIDVSVAGTSYRPVTTKAVVPMVGCHVEPQLALVYLTRPPTNSGAACLTPADVSTLVSSWKPPTGFGQGKCTDTQIGALVDCLNALPDAATCKTFVADAANKSCGRCAIRASTAATYGPLVEGTVTIDVNEAGCIALATGDVSTAGCGAKVLALRQCEELACEVNCPVPAGDDGTALAALLACQKNSDATSCKAFADGAACAVDAERDAGPAAVCLQTGAMFTDNAKAMVKLFCGGNPSDGGLGDATEGG